MFDSIDTVSQKSFSIKYHLMVVLPFVQLHIYASIIIWYSLSRKSNYLTFHYLRYFPLWSFLHDMLNSIIIFNITQIFNHVISIRLEKSPDYLCKRLKSSMDLTKGSIISVFIRLSLTAPLCLLMLSGCIMELRVVRLQMAAGPKAGAVWDDHLSQRTTSCHCFDPYYPSPDCGVRPAQAGHAY